MLKLGMQFLDAIAVKVDGPVATAHVDFPVPQDKMVGLLGPAMTASREAAMRAQGMNQHETIGACMPFYVSVHKYFPPAAIRDKDGKPLLSWRVAVLPFIEDSSFGVAKGGQPLYNEFHLDEPWDSEHNKALIAKMPAAFRDPHERCSEHQCIVFHADW